MILTGKCKERFFEIINYNEFTFSLLSDLHKNALIIEFFDSVGIYIDVGVNQITDKNTNKSNCNFDVAIFHPHHRTDEGRTLTQLNINISRQEATIQAIKKTNNLYNEYNKAGF